MAFIAEKIKRDSEERKYIASKGFTYITGEPLFNARSWTVDRERDIILVSRGGGGLEMPRSYGLYMDGFLIDIEGDDENEGDYYGSGSKIHWFITWIGVPKGWFESGCGTEKLKQIIKEAFTAYAYINLNPARILEVTVEINAEPIQKYNSKGEEV